MYQRKYDPMWINVQEEQFMTFLREIYVILHGDKVTCKNVQTIEDFEKFFNRTIHEDGLMGRKRWPSFEIREDGVACYTTTSNRLFGFNPDTREVYSRNLRDSIYLLSFCDECFGNHTKEWDGEFFTPAPQQSSLKDGESQQKFVKLLVDAARG